MSRTPILRARSSCNAFPEKQGMVEAVAQPAGFSLPVIGFTGLTIFYPMVKVEGL